MKPTRAAIALLLAGVLPFTGCQTYEEFGLTHKLWSDASLTDHYEPAGTAAVKTFQRPPSPRLLVSYDERREKDSSVRRRAFFLPDSAKALAEHGKPSFTHRVPRAALFLSVSIRVHPWFNLGVRAESNPARSSSLHAFRRR